jgi:hypothetical protein
MTIFLSITTIAFAIAFGYFAYRAYILAGLLADSDDHHESVEMTNMYMYSRIYEAYNRMTTIDRIGAFEKDDEAGTTFALLKEVIDTLKMEFDGEATSEEKK